MARLAFLGSPPFAAATLEALLDAHHDVLAVVTRAPRRRGRRGEPEPTAVGALAAARGIPVTHQVRDLESCPAELGVVVAFGRLVPKATLDHLPMVNLHLSLLPRWRGAAPVERAILAGDTEAGVCLMALEEGLDTGPVYEEIRVPIGETETAAQLTGRLASLGTDALLRRLAGGVAGLGEPSPQVGEPAYAEKLTVEDRHLDFTEPAVRCLRRVRVGRAWTTFRGRRLLVHEAAIVPLAAGPPGVPGALVGNVVTTGEGGLELRVVQAEGRASTPFAAFANGAHLAAVEHLGDAASTEGGQ